MTSSSPEVHLNFFYPTICHTCKNNVNNLKRCSICKTVAYCSADHQKGDWKSHKKLCKVIAKTDKTVTYKVGCTSEEWKVYRLTLQAAWLCELKRNLYPFECHMWMFPRACEVCHSKDIAIDCDDCLSISYCSDEHKEEIYPKHKEYCGGLKLILKINQYLWRYRSFPHLKIKFFDDDYNSLTTNIDLLFSEILKEPVNETIDFILKTDMLSPNATILYGMEKISIVQNRKINRTTLTIHLVGASSYEENIDWNITTEFMLHWIKDLFTIKWLLIGPELKCSFGSTILNNFCSNCQKSCKSAIITQHKCLYHEIVDELEPPDIVVAFNCGFHEFENVDTTDTWKGTIPFLLKNSNVPLLFTSYTQFEMEQDFKRLKESVPDVNTIIERHKNPFASKKPIRDCCIDKHDVPYFYTNGNIAIVHKTNVF